MALARSDRLAVQNKSYSFCYAFFISVRVALGAKQLDVFRLLVSEGTIMHLV